MALEEKINKFMPEIEPYLKGAPVVFKFWGQFFMQWLGEMDGLFVFTEDTIYVRGKATFKSGWGGIAKSGDVRIIPYQYLRTLITKKNKAVIVYDGAMEGKPGNQGKMTIAPYPEKGESKEDYITRANVYFDYIKKKAGL